MVYMSDDITSIPLHQTTVQLLRGVKSADQTWDDLLLALADDYLPPALRRELDRRLRSERVVTGASMKSQFESRRRKSAKVPDR